MRHLQKFQVKYGEKGLVLLGLNCADDKKIALEFLQETTATYPSILDTSRAAQRVKFFDYRTDTMPTNYIIDREGKIVGGWFENDEGFQRALAALKKAGLKIEEP
jgi:thiol-disulfide isomerase/thioredoxin